ncbi:MAG: NAD(P)/FAD-dependent oxidoreductase [Chitinophagaceae bacterium]
MEWDVLVVGQGLSGTWLCHYLRKAGLSFGVVEDGRPQNASAIAAGVINPITGRRIVKTWLIDELLPFARKAYTQAGEEMNIPLHGETDIIDLPLTPQMKLAYEQRLAETPEYVSRIAEPQTWQPWLHYDQGAYRIQPALLIQVNAFIQGYRKILVAGGQWLKETFEPALLGFSREWVSYKEHKARYIIFCDGMTAFTHPWFSRLPFAACKGEALWIRSEELPQDVIFKKGVSLIPLGHHHFWVGSSYEWQFSHPGPTEEFRNRMDQHLKKWLKVPFQITDHQAALRPATLERRPFVGVHPLEPRLALLNGMGTKGCSLAPYFAHQLVQQLTAGTKIHPEACITRFHHLLGRS